MTYKLPELEVIDRHLPTNVVIRGYTADTLRSEIAAAEKRGAEQREAELMAKTQGISQKMLDDLQVQLEKAYDEINCAESALESASCDFPIDDERFNQGFECLGDFVQAVSMAYREKLAAARLQGAREEPVNAGLAKLAHTQALRIKELEQASAVNQELLEAAQQCVDDMADSYCVCPAAKEQLIAAIAAAEAHTGEKT